MEIKKHTKTEFKVEISESTKIKDVLQFIDVKNDRLCVYINNEYPEEVTEDTELKKGDVVRIQPELQGGDGGGSKFITTLLQVGLLAGSLAVGGLVLNPIGSAILTSGVLVGGSLVILGITSLFNRGLDQEQDIDSAQIPNYGLSGGKNRARTLKPLPIVMGEIRINPDISARPYNEPIGGTEITSEVPAWLNVGPPVYTFDSTTMTSSDTANFAGQDFNFNYFTVNYPDNYLRVDEFDYYNTLQEAKDADEAQLGDSICFTYVYITNAVINPLATRDKFVLWSDLVANGASATFIDPAPGTTQDANGYVFELIEQTYVLPKMALKQIFNYGFGDLTIDQERIGNTLASSYQEYNEYRNTETVTNYPLAQVEPDILGAGGYPTFTPTTDVNGNVYTIQGSIMEGTTDTVAPFDNWVVRESPENTFAIMLDISGTQYKTNTSVPGGVEAIDRYFDFQYSDDNVTWNDFDNDLDGLTLPGPNYGLIPFATVSNKYTNVIFQNSLPPNKYWVRFRKVDPEDTDDKTVCKMSVDQIRFYVEDEDYNYLPQNRQGVTIEASAQLNGSLDTFSARVRAKCWAWDGVSSYTWDFTENPADWYLYFLRGGFVNQSANGSFVYPFSPTVGWVNSADHPDNERHLWGGGVSDSRIDFDSIQQWWNYCDSENLTFNAVLDNSKNVLEIFQDICSVGRGSPSKSNGKWGVIWEDIQQPVAVFTPDNIIEDSFRIIYNNQRNPDIIEVNFLDSSNNYEQSRVETIVPTVINPIERSTFTAWGVTNQAQAQRTSNLLAARILYNKRTIEFSTDAEGLIVSRGDVVILSHDLTQWGYSGRITDIETDGVNVISFGTSCEIDDSITNVTIRNVYNQITTYACTESGGRILLSDPWPIDQAPFYIDQNGTENPASIFPGTQVDDWIYTAGNVATPGKRVRIKEITVVNSNEVKLTCIDEEEAYYTYDTAGSLPPFTPAPDYERIKAIASNPNVVYEGPKQIVSWELSGCDAVSIMISVNGGAFVPLISGGATIYSNFVELFYSAGDNINMIITPVYVDSPFDVQSATLGFTV